ncbi:zinc-binding domain-containing protein [Xylariaceae sp. FL0255]|nr:zinc-binding domain-containing protein [Xylariaceae sp. FL0255]
MAKKGKKQIPRWSMWPSKHAEVSRLLDEDNLHFQFHHQDDEETAINSYDTNIMAVFQCRNPTCLNDSWSSRQVAITIRLYSGKRYNARVYHQHCLKCYSMSKPILDDSYAERVAYRLKKWSGIVDLNPPPYKKKGGPPHEKEHCEGCKAGHCLGSNWRQSRRY